MFNLAIRTAKVLAGAAMLQVLTISSAMAYATNIEAEAVCVEDQAVIYYTSSSWIDDPVKGINPDIRILVNNFEVGSGAYVYPELSFSGSTPAPSGSSAVVESLVAGNWGDGGPPGQSDSVTIDLPSDCGPSGEGRFTGGGHQIRIGDGVRITRGLTIHCDLLLSNNLQVNWAGGNKFHMTEHLTTVECSDDPEIIQAPPPAPLDTLVGVGEGRYNNLDGYTIEFTLQDGGEPGAGVDRMAILIYETANPGNVVLDVPFQFLTGGNLQAHYDQPHK